MRVARHRGSIAGVAGLAVVVAVGLTGCGEASESSADDDASTTTERPSTSTSTTVPRSTTSVLPACSTIDPAESRVYPATWLPAEVPDGWRLDAAATVGGGGSPAWTFDNQFVVLGGDTVTGMLAMGTRAVALEGSEPVTVRGTEGSWGFIGGRSLQAANPYLTWREDGVDWWVTVVGMEQAAVIDAVAPVELSSDPVRLTDPTGRVVQVADRPPDTGSTMVVLSYEAPGGTSPSALGGGTPSDGGEVTDRVQVVIEQFAPGGSGILVDNVSGALGQALGWRLATVDDRPVLRTPDDAGVPVASSGAQVIDGPDASVAVSVTGSPSTEDADAVMARVTPVEPSDKRLSTARVDVGELGEVDLTACLPD